MGFLDKAKAKAQELADAAKPKAEEAREKAKPMAGKVRDKSKDMGQHLKRSAEAFRDSYKGTDESTDGDPPPKA